MLDCSVKYEFACQDGEQLAIFHLQIDCMECVSATCLFHVSTSTTFTPNFQSIPRGLRMFYAYVPRVDFHSLLLRLISASIPCGLRVFSTCQLPLLLRLISTSIPCGLRMF